MPQSFNIDQALKNLQAGKDITGKDGILMPLIKQLTKEAIIAVIMFYLASKINNLYQSYRIGGLIQEIKP